VVQPEQRVEAGIKHGTAGTETKSAVAAGTDNLGAPNTVQLLFVVVHAPHMPVLTLSCRAARVTQGAGAGAQAQHAALHAAAIKQRQNQRALTPSLRRCHPGCCGSRYGWTPGCLCSPHQSGRCTSKCCCGSSSSKTQRQQQEQKGVSVACLEVETLLLWPSAEQLHKGSAPRLYSHRPKNSQPESLTNSRTSS
jgi:hypothetical protein